MSLSCDCGDSDIQEVQRKLVIARKPHVCCECSKDIQVGEACYMSHFYNFEERKPSSMLFQCEVCGDMMENLKNLGYCFNYTEVWDAMEEYQEIVESYKWRPNDQEI